MDFNPIEELELINIIKEIDEDLDNSNSNIIIQND